MGNDLKAHFTIIFINYILSLAYMQILKVYHQLKKKTYVFYSPTPFVDLQTISQRHQEEHKILIKLFSDYSWVTMIAHWTNIFDLLTRMLNWLWYVLLKKIHFSTRTEIRVRKVLGLNKLQQIHQHCYYCFYAYTILNI